MGVVPIYDFLRLSSKVLDFHGENLATCHLTFVVEIRHRLALDDMDCDNQSEKVNAYIPRAWPKYRCRKVNRGHHTLEMRTNGTWHDIPNTTHPKREREEEGRGFKRVQKPNWKS